MKTLCMECGQTTEAYMDGVALGGGTADWRCGNAQCGKIVYPDLPQNVVPLVKAARSVSATEVRPAAQGVPSAAPAPALPLDTMFDQLRLRRAFVIEEIARLRKYEHELAEIDLILSIREEKKS